MLCNSNFIGYANFKKKKKNKKLVSILFQIITVFNNPLNELFLLLNKTLKKIEIIYVKHFCTLFILKLFVKYCWTDNQITWYCIIFCSRFCCQLQCLIIWKKQNFTFCRFLLKKKKKKNLGFFFKYWKKKKVFFQHSNYSKLLSSDNWKTILQNDEQQNTVV